MNTYLTITAGLIGLIALHSAATAATVSLGTASTYAVLGGSAVTNTGTSVLTGNLGVSPASAITGFPPGVVIGEIHSDDAAAAFAQADALQAYNDLGALAVTTDLSGQNLALTLTTGVYTFSSSAGLNGTLTLSGPGTFVFLVETTFTTSSGSMVNLINGASAADVYFRVGSSATLGTNSDLKGTIIANTSITATTGASVQGRLIALNGTVTLDSNQVTVPVPEPASAMVSIPLLGLLAVRRKRGL